MAETEERRSEGTEVGQGGTRREWETDLDFGGHLGGEKKPKKKTWWGWMWYAQSSDVLAWASLGLSLMPALCLA